MRTENLFCKLCGNPIEDAAYLKKLGYKHTPKYCVDCRRKVRDYRFKEVIETHLIKEWDRVVLTQSFMDILKEMPKESKSLFMEKYVLHAGNIPPWSGKRFDKFIYVFIHPDVKVGDQVIVQLKKKKQWHRRNEKLERAISSKIIEKTDEGILLEHEFISIVPDDKNKEGEAVSKILPIKSYYKTTLKGYGKNRNYQEYVEGDYDEVVSVRSWANSGRFGNQIDIVIANINANIKSTGVA